MNLALKREILAALGWFALLLLAGWTLGSMAAGAIIGLSLYVLWQWANLRRLLRWLSRPSKQVPESRGVWDEIYYQLYHLYQRQRKARKKLTSIVARFQASTEALPYAAVVLNAEMEIEWFNRAAKQLFGLRNAVDSGQRIDNLIRNPVFTRYLSQRDHAEPIELDIHQHKILVTLTAYGNGQFLLTARDVTLRRQLDEVRRNFVSNASHELRTPITVMSGYIEMMQQADCPDIGMPLQKLQQQTQRMVSIIDELIELAKLESAPQIDGDEVTDIDALLSGVFQQAQALDGGRHELVLNNAVHGQGLRLNARQQELDRALGNLLGNAIRYTADGGRIELYARLDAGELMLGVKDDGIGIDYAHIPRLTERFYRVDEGRSREQGGTGLGLSIVKHVLDHHGANLAIHSRPGAGSDFACVFDARRLID